MRTRLAAATSAALLGLLIASWVVAQSATLQPAGRSPASAQPQAPAGTDAPAVKLRKTVGTDPNICAATTAIEVTPGTEVTYCYTVENTGTLTLTRHSLTDTELGPLLNGLAYALAPGGSAFMTTTATLVTTTVNVATWTAYNPGPTDVVTATAQARVDMTPPRITLNKTVGTDPNVCAATGEIAVPHGSDVTYCYEVTNTGPYTLTHHTLEDSALGLILSGLAYGLVPGASAFITATATITATTVNTATWTAAVPETELVATDYATATVIMEAASVTVTPANVSAVVMAGLTRSAIFKLANKGNEPLEWTVDLAPVTCDEPGFVSWAIALPVDGVTPPGSRASVELTLDSAGLDPGIYTAVFCVRSNDPGQPVVARLVSLTVQPPTILLPVVTGAPSTGR